MALVKCTECGGQVSDKAKTCPACGAPTKKPANPWVTAFIVFIGLAIGGGFFVAAMSNESMTNLEAAGVRKLSDGTLTQGQADALSTLIRLRGFECEQVNRIKAIGKFPEGRVIRAYCGPSDQPTGIDTNLTYWVATDAMQVKPCASEPRC